MPRYDFICDVDGEVREESVSIKDLDAYRLECRQGHTMRRVFFAARFVMAGKFAPFYWGYDKVRNDGLTPLAE